MFVVAASQRKPLAKDPARICVRMPRKLFLALPRALRRTAAVAAMVALALPVASTGRAQPAGLAAVDAALAELPAGSPRLLTEPFLQRPERTSVRVVWLTNFPGVRHEVTYGGQRIKRCASARAERWSGLTGEPIPVHADNVMHLDYVDDAGAQRTKVVAMPQTEFRSCQRGRPGER